MFSHEQYMQRCIDLAKKGNGYTAPNPLVGSVIVYENKIIGEGFHQKYGMPHAEVNAINAVSDVSLLEKSTLYVNLEPCAHFGKTPPCSNLIIEKKIPNVVIGCSDPFLEVAGKGIEKLKKAGINVITDVLKTESRDLNKRFFTFHEKNRPYVILKWAQSADGFIDIDRSSGKKGIFWLSEPETKTLVHRWRHEEAAILVGWKTIANDNPELTCREIPGNNPLRLVIDPDLRLDYTAFKVGDHTTPTLIFTKKNALSAPQLKFVTTNDFSIPSILKILHEQSVLSVIIEGGKTTIEEFIASGIWDEARIITGNKKIKEGVLAPKINGKEIENYFFGNDQIKTLKNV